jgi:hypothetical protein
MPPDAPARRLLTWLQIVAVAVGILTPVAAAGVWAARTEVDAQLAAVRAEVREKLHQVELVRVLDGANVRGIERRLDAIDGRLERLDGQLEKLRDAAPRARSGAQAPRGS